MKITKIEPQKRNRKRMSVYIDGAFAFGVDMEVAYVCGLKEGLEVDKEWIDAVVQKEELLRAQNYALNLLSFRARSEKEIAERMAQKGYEPFIIDKTIAYLKEQGYINDKAFAEAFIKDKSELNGYGRNRIRWELYKKGVSRELVDELLEEVVTPDEEYEKAKMLAERKMKLWQKDPKPVQYRKLSGLLARKGYPFDLVSKVARELVYESDVLPDENIDF